MAIDLVLKISPAVGLDLSALTARIADRLTAGQLAREPVWHGRERSCLGDWFSISGNGDDLRWHWSGDLRQVDGLGTGLSAGSITVEGDVGNRLGLGMSGGEIVVSGNAGDDAGAGMSGGVLRVGGNVGARVGGSLPGRLAGMRGGWILVAGNSQAQLGTGMRRGVILVAGDAGELVGWRMLAGTILVRGRCRDGVGAEMVRGTIALGDPLSRSAISSTFASSGLVEPVVLRLLARAAEERLTGRGDWLQRGAFEMFAGDRLHGGRGELWLAAER